MNTVRKIIGFCVDSSFWVALSVCALVKITYINNGLTTNKNLLWAVFFGTISGYNFVKYFESKHLYLLKEINIQKHWLQFKNDYKYFSFSKKLIAYISGSSILLAGCFLLKLKLGSVFLLLLPIILTFFYVIALRKKSLRAVSGLKVYIVGFVWAFVTVLFPLYEEGVGIESDEWLTFAQRLVFVLVLILPFEIRDLRVDDASLRTLPQSIGVKNTKFFGLILAMLFLFLEFFKDEILSVNLIIMPLIFIISVLFLVLAKEKQSKYYSSFFVEGVPIIWLLLLLVL